MKKVGHLSGSNATVPGYEIEASGNSRSSWMMVPQLGGESRLNQGVTEHRVMKSL